MENTNSRRPQRVRPWPHQAKEPPPHVPAPQWLTNPFSMKNVGWKIFFVVMYMVGYHEVHGIWPFS
jgi:hypothetical protein